MKKNQINFSLRLLSCSFFAGIILFSLISASYAQQISIPRVTTRGVEEQGFGRLIFDWPSIPEFEEARDGRSLTLTFGEPAIFVTARAAIQLNDYIESISQTGVSTVIVRLSDDFTTRSFRNGNSVIVDILRESALASEAPPEEQGETVDGEARVFRVAPDRIQTSNNPPSNINIRIGNHSGYDRIAINWPVSVAYNTELIGRRLTINFDTRFSADLGQLNNDLRERLQRAPRQSADNRSLELEFNTDVNLRDFSYDNIIVLDLIRSSPVPQSTFARAAEARPDQFVFVRNGRHPDYTRIVFDYTTPTNYIIERDNGRLQVTFSNPKKLSLQSFSRDSRNLFNDPEIEQFGNSARFSISIPDNFNFRHFESGTKIVVDLLEQVERNVFYPVNEIRVTPGQFQHPSFPLPAPNLQTRQERNVLPPVLYRAEFEFPEAVGIAIFERLGSHWVVADRADITEAEVDLGRILETSSDLFSTVERIPHPEATILRFVTNETLFTSVVQRGLTWEIRFHRRATPPLTAVDLHIIQNNQLDVALSLLAEGAGNSITIQDPTLNDTILIGALQTPGQGLIDGRGYPEFSLLPSAQGIAVIPFSDSIRLQKTNSGFQLVQENGLSIDELPIDDRYAERGYLASAAPLLKFSTWSRGDEKYLDVRDELNRLLSESREDGSLNNLLLTTAGYHLSQGLGANSLGLLNVFQRRNPLILNNLSFKLHKAASLLLLNRVEEAIDFLKDPQFSQYEEAVLWQGVAAAMTKRWLVADSYFKQSDSFLDRYPIDLRNKLGLLRIEAALSSNEAINAGLWIDRLEKSRSRMTQSQQNALDFMRAWRSSILGEEEEAKRIWLAVAKNNDLFWSTRAQLQAVLQQIKNNEIDPKEAAGQLEHLRYLWRGDNLELSIREVLIDIYFNDRNYEEGFFLARNTVASFSESAQAQILSQKMLNAFSDLLFDQKARSLTSIETYKIYNDFSELTPVGQTGHKLIENVADRMILDNLYDTAINTLTDRLLRRLSGEEKKRITVKIALLYIADNRPDEALDTLQKSFDSDDTTSPLFTDVRQLQAKALSDQGQFDEALSLIAGDVSNSADLLRRDIYWEREDWQRAAQAMERLVGPVPRGEDTRFDDIEASLLVSWAIALRLADEQRSLRALNDNFAHLLQGNALEQVFQFIVSEPNIRSQEEDIGNIINLAVQDGQFTVFLDNYRERYFPPPLVVSTVIEEGNDEEEDNEETPSDPATQALLQSRRLLQTG